MSLSERVRAAKAQEEIGRANVAASNYRTSSSYALGSAQLQETALAHRNAETLQENQRLSYDQQQQANREQAAFIELNRQELTQRQIDEQARRNKAQENLQRWGIAVNAATGVANAAAKLIPLIQQSGQTGSDTSGTIPFVGNAEYLPLG